MNATGADAEVTDAATVPYLGVAESAAIARAELDCFVQLIGELRPDDLGRATHCALWSVRDVVAHQASHAESGAGLRGFFGQMSPKLTWRYQRRGMSLLDALNQAQVDRRSGLPFDTVVTELRDNTMAAIGAREHLAWPAGVLRLPVPPTGLMTLSRLLTEIFPRDMWIHRLDIADATGRTFDLGAPHNRTFIAGIVRDAARCATRSLPQLAVRLQLRGDGGRVWSLGAGEPLALEMDALEFARLVSGRTTPEAALTGTSASATPDAVLRVLGSLKAPF